MNRAGTRDWPWSEIVGGVFLVLALTLAWKYVPLGDWTTSLMDRIEGMGAWGYVAFYVIYVVAALVGIPRTPLNVGAGIVFSFSSALTLVLAASATGNVLTFQIARHFVRQWVAKRVENIPNADRIMEAVEREGFKLVFLLRLNPFVPAVLKGYGFGTTRLSFATYIVASVLGSLPILAAHVYLGVLGGEVMINSEQHPAQWRLALMLGGGVVSVILIVLISWYAHRAIHSRQLQST